MVPNKLPLIHYSKRMALRLRRWQKGFTLVELLAVLAIVITMTALAVPAFTGISRGSSLKAAGNSLSSLALLARQNSQSKNALTALVMIGPAGTEGDFRAFSLYEISPHSDGTPVGAGDWKQITAWETLRDGIVADFCTFTANSIPMTPPFPALSYRGAAVPAYQYVVFLPSGGMYSSVPAQIRLVAGYLQPGSQSVTYTGPKGVDGHAANYYEISILSSNGRVKVDRP